MDSETFWTLVTHQANRPITHDQGAVMADITALPLHDSCGDREAMLAACYYYGLGRISPDFEACVHWAIKSCDKQHAWGHFYLGVCYHLGQGVLRDDIASFQHMSVAADAGLPLALLDLGHLYREGSGVTQNEKKAYELFRMAADKGLALGLFMVAYCYEAGLGVVFDLNEAKVNYQKAIDMGLALATSRLDAIKQHELYADRNN